MWQGALELVAPRRCGGCDLVLELDEEGFCGGCEPLLEDGGEVVAPHWGAVPFPWAAFDFVGPMAEAVRRLKYGGRTDLVGDLGERLAAHAGRFAGYVDEVVPVPLHGRRLRMRGFNQAALLAAPVAAWLGVPLRVRRLRRIRDTRAQASLRQHPRASNVRSAFAVRGRPAAGVLLVDDVATSGATLAAARTMLLEAGATRVHALVLARAPA